MSRIQVAYRNFLVHRRAHWLKNVSERDENLFKESKEGMLALL